MTQIHFRRRGFSMAAAAVTTILLALFGAAGCAGAGTTIARLTVGDPGPDPYAPARGTDQRLASAHAGTPPPGGTSTGDSPGLYGGTRRTSSCDKQRLVTFLMAHPDRADAWASVQRIEPSAIAAYVARLTPVRLRADTLVTNHGFRDGKATGAPAVLEAGTGVLINEFGIPAVKCNCGNPLTAPDPRISPTGARYSGPSWPDFHAGKVTRIRPGRAPAQAFVLSDPDGGGAFTRPRGTQGAQDGPQIPEPAPGTAAPHVHSAPAPAPSGSPRGDLSPAPAPVPSKPGSTPGLPPPPAPPWSTPPPPAPSKTAPSKPTSTSTSTSTAPATSGGGTPAGPPHDSPSGARHPSPTSGNTAPGGHGRT
ncbi:DUF6777 domain-containing protein [Actinomadura gamaensis]|uniref:DUF6777 domain-containing protein n=1 Tax=Actinomadura gamaensis TaxID=1763541 RepID=A0ABV9U1T3_9ACTN